MSANPCHRAFISGDELHRRIGNGWPALFTQLGVPEQYFERNAGRRSSKPGPCPGCGGEDRYHFDDKYGHGDYFCRGCGHGDGFKLLGLVFGWSFAEARRRVMQALGMSAGEVVDHRPLPPVATAPASAATPSPRVLKLRRDRCLIEHCKDAVDYLATRGLWPLPPGCALKAHAAVDYFSQDRQLIGRYAALVADVVDADGDLVTCHVTYLHGGQKLTPFQPRKLLGPMTERVGCAIRLMPAGETLGVAEGIETALSAALLDNVPVWSTVNNTLLAKFEPPQDAVRLLVYADRDEAGLSAACRLMERLQGRIRVEMRIPAPPHRDWNDVLRKTAAVAAKDGS